MDKTLQAVREQIASKAKWSKSQLAAVNDPQDQCDEYEHEHFTGMVDAYDIALAIIDEAAAKQASERCLADELNAALNLIGEHCGKHLAPGWVLSIHHDNGEQWIQLEDAEGNDIDAWMHDSTHAIVDACDFSLAVHHG
jgi:hypothetical protein